MLEAAINAPEKALLPVPADLSTPEAKKAYAKSLVQKKREKKKDASTHALIIGISIGLVIEALRKLLRASKGYQAFKARGKTGFAVDFALDTVVLASPYASSFGGFVDFTTCLWFGIGGIFSSYSDTVRKEVKAAPSNEG